MIADFNYTGLSLVMREVSRTLMANAGLAIVMVLSGLIAYIMMRGFDKVVVVE